VSTDEEIALVITDLEMPEMDGLELTRRIRARSERPSLPVVIVTSRGDADDRRRGVEAGADAYIIKQDFDQQALLDIVERLAGDPAHLAHLRHRLRDKSIDHGLGDSVRFARRLEDAYVDMLSRVSQVGSLVAEEA